MNDNNLRGGGSTSEIDAGMMGMRVVVIGFLTLGFYGIGIAGFGLYMIFG